MVLVVLVAVVVLAVVAVPQVREGRTVLTPQGRDSVRLARRTAGRAARQAREKAAEVGQGTRERAASLRERGPGSAAPPATAAQLAAAPAPELASVPVPEPAPAVVDVRDPRDPGGPRPVAAAAAGDPPARTRPPLERPVGAHRPQTRATSAAPVGAVDRPGPGPRHARS